MVQLRARVSLMLLALAVNACGPVSRLDTARPSQPLASNACGGFHLVVANDDPYAVDVDINGGSAGTVEPHSQTVLVKLFRPELPDFPWVVELSRADDGLWVGTAELDDGVTDTRITVSGGQIEVGDLDLASLANGCAGTRTMLRT